MNAGSLDQFVPYDLQEAKDEVFDKIEAVMEQALIRGPEIALQYGLELRKSGQLKGYALAHLLWQLRQNWSAFATDDDFETGIFKEMGYSTDTVYKYVRLWEDIFANDKVPDTTKRHLLGLPMNTTNLLVSSIKKGEVDWEEVENVVDQKDVKEIVDKAKGRAPKESDRLVLLLERDGRLRAKKGNSTYTEFGFLRRDIWSGEADSGTKEDDLRREAVGFCIEKLGVVVR
jgi:hypothetical protein